jgi:hypothetical protein
VDLTIIVLVLLAGIAAWWASQQGVMMLMSSEPVVNRLADAIATAEGYWSPSSLPNRLNNPGDLKDSSGNLIHFDTPEDGWAALRKQVRMMLTGTSKIYRPDMTIRQVAQLYTGGDNAEGWAQTVASQFGVDPDRSLYELA